MFSRNLIKSRYLARFSMTSCPENCYYGDVKKKEYSWADVNGPVMAAIEVNFIGQGAVSWYNDVLQTKESVETQPY